MTRRRIDLNRSSHSRSCCITTGGSAELTACTGLSRTEQLVQGPKRVGLASVLTRYRSHPLSAVTHPPSLAKLPSNLRPPHLTSLSAEWPFFPCNASHVPIMSCVVAPAAPITSSPAMPVTARLLQHFSKLSPDIYHLAPARLSPVDQLYREQVLMQRSSRVQYFIPAPTTLDAHLQSTPFTQLPLSHAPFPSRHSPKRLTAAPRVFQRLSIRQNDLTSHLTTPTLLTLHSIQPALHLVRLFPPLPALSPRLDPSTRLAHSIHAHGRHAGLVVYAAAVVTAWLEFGFGRR